MIKFVREAGLNTKTVDDHRCVGAFVGTDKSRDKWTAKNIDASAHGVERLASVGRKHPQTAFAGLTKSLLNKWQHLQQVAHDKVDHFALVEAAVATKFMGSSRHVQPPSAARSGRGNRTVQSYPNCLFQ